MTVERLFLAIGAGSACIAVAAGAFGAHGLRSRLSAELLAVFEIAVRYQMYHALALIACAWAATRWPGALVNTAGWLFVGGTIVFSGSLYALSLSGVRWLGAVTPLGGLALLGGWLCLVAAAIRAPPDRIEASASRAFAALRSARAEAGRRVRVTLPPVIAGPRFA